jgi:hypothetical protein
MRFGRVARRGACMAVVFGSVFAGQASAATQLGVDGTPPAATGTRCSANFTRFPTNTPDQFRVPTPGVITSWSFTTGDDAFTDFKFKVARFLNGTDTGLTVAASPANLPANTRTTTRARIPVLEGDRIGFYNPTPGDCFIADSGSSVQIISGDPQPGQTNDYQSGSQDLVNPVSARLEPDADNDGYGDETQDQCPTNASTQGTCPPPVTPSGTTTVDKTKPTLGGLSFSSTVFRAANFGGSTAKKKAPVGTKVSFSLSEASSVKFTVQRKTKGRKVGHKCKTKTHANRKKKSCTLWKAVKGSFTIKGKPGKNTFTFTGRIGGKSLKPASYRLNGTATDPSKNASVPKRKGFKIVK